MSHGAWPTSCRGGLPLSSERNRPWFGRLRFPAVAAREDAARLKPFGIVVGVVEMVAVVLCPGPRRGGENEHQESDDESETDIGPGRPRGRRCSEPVGVKTATAAILLAAYRPDFADLFRAPAAAVAEVTCDMVQSHHGLHCILPITLLAFRTSFARSCALDHAACAPRCQSGKTRWRQPLLRSNFFQAPSGWARRSATA
jgi:hypothetical protein